MKDFDQRDFFVGLFCFGLLFSVLLTLMGIAPAIDMELMR